MTDISNVFRGCPTCGTPYSKQPKPNPRELKYAPSEVVEGKHYWCEWCQGYREGEPEKGDFFEIESLDDFKETVRSKEEIAALLEAKIMKGETFDSRCTHCKSFTENEWVVDRFWRCTACKTQHDEKSRAEHCCFL